jgi:hypothetical protein
MGKRRTRVTLVGALSLFGLMISLPVDAQASTELRVTVDPETVAPSGELVRVTVEVVVSSTDQPATVTALSSSSFGNLSDAANPALVSTDCSVPASYVPTPGFEGMACAFEVVISGEPGDISDTLFATIMVSGGSEVTLSQDLVVNISEQLGAIQGTLIDFGTGQPIPETFVWGTCDGCGGFTGPDGVFVFLGVEPGEYRLRSGSASPGGWAPTSPTGYQSGYAFEYFDEEPFGPVAFPNPGMALTVLPGQTTEIQWDLSLGGAIEGVLTASDTGDPISDFEVQYWITDGGAASPSDVGGYWSVGGAGTYRIHGLRAGDYIVCFQTPFGCECWDDIPSSSLPPDRGDAVPVVLGQTITGIDAQFITGDVGGAEAGDGEPPMLPFTGISPYGLILGIGVISAGVTLLAISRLGNRITQERARSGCRRP